LLVFATNVRFREPNLTRLMSTLSSCMLALTSLDLQSVPVPFTVIYTLSAMEGDFDWNADLQQYWPPM